MRPLAAAICLLALGCGGPPAKAGGDGGEQALDRSACSGPAVCGGDLVGTWRVGSWCLATYYEGCARVDDSMATETGTLRFGSDLTYSASLTRSGTQITSYGPDSTCGSVSDCASTCAGNGTVMAGTSTPDQCDCSGSVDGAMLTLSGTYEVTGSGGLKLDGRAAQLYCVQGDRLWILDPGDSPALFAVYSRQ